METSGRGNDVRNSSSEKKQRKEKGSTSSQSILVIILHSPSAWNNIVSMPMATAL